MSATIGTRLFTLVYGRKVGQDEFGNRYFEQRRAAKGEKARRWVIYNGMAEPSKVPAHWHGWLHYTLDAPIPEAARRYSWQKEHVPNLTGTQGRYLPAGHIEKSATRAKATADYQPWTPQ
ncbi:MAG: NADH:ubiquinone oxidoreductase subunit NDUFA12 [Azospirillum brasilense]|nr:MAG: NADH:ubiquinone oxidoreductase subunit NDUFA12 [Azospirillum brasilense]